MKNEVFKVTELFFMLDIIIVKMHLKCSYAVTEHNITYMS